MMNSLYESQNTYLEDKTEDKQVHHVWTWYPQVRGKHWVPWPLRQGFSCSRDCFGIHSVDQTPNSEINLLLGLKLCTTTAWLMSL